MALTITSQAVAGKAPSAPLFVDRVLVAFDASYPTGGELFNPAAAIGAGKSLVGVPPVVTTGKVVVWDRAAGKLKLLDDTLAEVANASDQSGVSVEVLVISQ